MNLRVKAIQKGINKNIAASSEMLKKQKQSKNKNKKFLEIVIYGTEQEKVKI